MKSSTIIGIIVALLVIILGVYWYMPSSNTYQSPTPQPVPAAQGTPQSATVNSTTVDISNYAFVPSPLTIRVGTKVTWTNNDTVPHTITSDTDNVLSSPQLAPGQTYSYTFTSAGTYNYHCSVHPTMKGSVTVQ